MRTVFKRDAAKALADAALKTAIDRTTVTAERKRAAALDDHGRPRPHDKT